MKWHPFAERFPMLEGDEWTAFKASISKTKGPEQKVYFRTVNGVKQGLDGRNRFRACEQLGIRCPLEEVFLDDEQAIDFIIRRNILRRHMSAQLRLTIVEELTGQGKSQREIAKAIGVSKSTVQCDQQTLSNGTPTGENNGGGGQKRPLAQSANSQANGASLATGARSITSTNQGKNGSGSGKKGKTGQKAPQSGDSDESIIKDKAGAIVPEKTRGAFVVVGQFNKISKLLNDAKKMIVEIINSEAGHFLKGRIPHFETAVKNVSSQLNIGRPAYVCPYCDGKKENCDCCKDCGWVPLHVYKTSPRGDKKVRA